MKANLLAVAVALTTLMGIERRPLHAQDDGLTPEWRADDRLCSRGVDLPQNGGREMLERALAEASGVRATFLRGCQQLGARRWDPAARDFEAAVKAEPGNPVFHFWAGRAHADQAQAAHTLRQPGLARKTKSDWERSLALAPDYISPREALVQYALRAPGFLGGGADKARAHVAEIARRNPYRGGFATATVALRSGDTTVAMQAYQRLTEQYPDSGVPWIQWSMLHLVRRDAAGAWRVADQLERRLPTWKPARYHVGRLAAETGEQLERGEPALREYLSYEPRGTDPTRAAAWFRLGMIHQRRGDREKAREAYQEVLALEPQHRPAQEALAKLK